MPNRVQRIISDPHRDRVLGLGVRFSRLVFFDQRENGRPLTETLTIHDGSPAKPAAAAVNVSGKNSDVIRKRVIVAGNVQGVFFRDSCQQAAQQHNVAGWVANRGDGSVEAVFEGNEEAVREMLEWVRRGPSRADVTDVDVTDEQPEGLGDFSVR